MTIKKLKTGLAAATLALMGATSAHALSLELVENGPLVEFGEASFDFFADVDADELAAFGAELSVALGVEIPDTAELDFILGINPNGAFDGDFTVSDGSTTFLSGQVTDVFSGDDLVTVFFDTIGGTVGDIFGEFAIAEIFFDDNNDELGTDALANFEDGGSYLGLASLQAALQSADPVTVSPVPLPAGVVLMLTGLGGLAMTRRRKV